MPRLIDATTTTNEPSHVFIGEGGAVKKSAWSVFKAFLSSLYAPVTRSISGGGLVTGGGDLSEDRTLTVTAASQAEAEAGTNTTKAMTPQRVAQAIEHRRGANDGICPLDSSGKVPSANLPSFVDDVLEYANEAALPGTGASGVLYVTLDNGKVWRWSGSAYVEITSAPDFASEAEAAAGSNNTKSMTPLRTAQAIAAQAVTSARSISGGGLVTGGGDLTTNRTLTVTAASQAEAEAGTNTTKAMTPERTAQAIAAQAAPISHTHAISDTTGLQTALDGKAASSHTHAISDTTGLQTALDGKAASSHTHAQSEVTNLVSDLALKAPLDSPALTGNPTAPSQAVTDDSTRLATTAFVQDVADLHAARAGVNAKEYGARGDARKVTDGVSTNGSTTVTSASNPWSAADVGKVIWGVNTGTRALNVPLGTISAVVSAGQITVSNAATASSTGLHLVWGTNDTAALQAAHAAAKAMQPRGIVEVPAGGYIFDQLVFDLTESTAGKVGGVRGHGTGATIFFPSPGHNLSNTAMLLKTNGNCYDSLVEGFSVEGCYFQWSASGKHVIEMGGFIKECIQDVRVDYLYGTTSGVSTTGYFTRINRVYLESLGYIGLSVSSGGSVWVSDSIFANCGLFSVSLDGITGTLNQKSFVRIENTWIDESNNGALDINNCTDVILQGVRINGPQSYAGLIVRGNSNVRVLGSELLPWGTTGNRPGVDVASGSTLWLTNCRIDASGTSHALTNAGTVYLQACRVAVSGSGTGLVNTGTVIDGGANSVASRSGAGTTRTQFFNWIDGPPGATMVIAPASGQNLNLYTTAGGNITLSGVVAVNAGLNFAENVNMAVGTSTGTKIGTATGQKIAFWNATPVAQQVLATGSTTDQVIALLQTLGLCRQS